MSVVCFVDVTRGLQELYQDVVLGMVIALSTSSPLLILATRNFVTGVIATINVLFISVASFGFLPILGFKLGVSSPHALCIIDFKRARRHVFFAGV